MRRISLVILVIAFLSPIAFAQTELTYQRPIPAEERLQRAINEIVIGFSEKYGTNAALAIKIIKCESGNKVNAIGRRAKIGLDMGLLQINTYFHEKKADEMGLDLDVPTESLEYGIWLLSQEGTRPWFASRKCWNT